jgi:hypothetical protein
VYARVVLERARLENNFKVMNLDNPLISEAEKEFLKDLIEEDTPGLDIVEFMKYYEEDGLGRMIKNTEYWLTNTFSLLNSFKNK